MRSVWSSPLTLVSCSATISRSWFTTRRYSCLCLRRSASPRTLRVASRTGLSIEIMSYRGARPSARRLPFKIIVARGSTLAQWLTEPDCRSPSVTKTAAGCPSFSSTPPPSISSLVVAAIRSWRALGSPHAGTSQSQARCPPLPGWVPPQEPEPRTPGPGGAADWVPAACGGDEGAAD